MERKIIYADDLNDSIEYDFQDGVCTVPEVLRCVERQFSIDPETLPIVKELREKLEEARRDCAVAERNHAKCSDKLKKANKTAENWERCWRRELEWRKSIEEKLARYEQAENVKDWSPVVHTHWEESFNGKIRCCPVCGTDFDATFHDIDTGWRYCPSCGAKMDDKEANQND